MSPVAPLPLPTTTAGVRVLHVLPSADDSYGGPGRGLRRLLVHDADAGVRSAVVAGSRRPGELATALGGLASTSLHPLEGRVGRLSMSASMLRSLWTSTGSSDVVVAHSVFDLAGICSAAVARARHTPFVLSPHGSLDPYDMCKHARVKKLLAPLWRTMLARTDVWCMTSREAEHLVTFGARPRTHVVPWPIEPSAPQDRGSAASLLLTRGVDVASARTVTSFVGRFDVKKGIPRLLDAFDAAAGDGDLLVLAGGGTPEQEQAVAAAVARADRRDQVVVPGWLRGADLHALLTCTDVFALASDDENFGNSVAEALAAGVPVVVTERVALADVVTAHGAGLVTAVDAAAFAGALRTYLHDPLRRARDGANGRRAVRAELSADAVAVRYRAMLDTAVRPAAVPRARGHHLVRSTATA